VSFFRHTSVSLPGIMRLWAVPTRNFVLIEPVELERTSRYVDCDMFEIIFSLFYLIRQGLRGRAALHAEILALRYQLLVLQRSKRSHRVQLGVADRIFWAWLSQLWSGWRSSLVIVKPETVIAWHRRGFRLYWAWKSRHRRGRPPVTRVVIDLIRKMSMANPRWGAPRIHGELLKLGFDLSESTVAKYMIRHRRPPSQTWRTFLTNHAKTLVSSDFFVVPTVFFRVLFVFVILSHDRRRPVHVAVTEYPTSEWVSHQLLEAFPWDSAPRYLLRDRDGSYGERFSQAAGWLGIREVLSAPQSPWQNPYVERLIGSIRRECLDHVIVLNETGLRRILKSYFEYYERSRTHLSLGKDTPVSRPVQAMETGRIVEIPQVGGLHHRYERIAA
jgi:putative transposase